MLLYSKINEITWNKTSWTPLFKNTLTFEFMFSDYCLGFSKKKLGLSILEAEIEFINFYI